QAEPVVTETMAELYLKQGHRDDALRVYHALLAQRPGDARLKTKIDALEGRKPASGVSAAAFLKGILRPEPPPAGDAQVSAIVAGAFEGAGEEAIPGAPTKPADDTISLDSVFGDGEAPAAAPPPGAAGAEPGSAAPGPESGFSFDQFFGGAQSAPGAGASSGGSGPRTSGRQARLPADDEADVDQFQAWLKKLKS
ncbi:MAG TPA: hypothetical protein VNI61_10255, partial [Gemmatimonadales bacterium]|nr:hypothetical protein [Gemmatimonadales bacterium]